MSETSFDPAPSDNRILAGCTLLSLAIFGLDYLFPTSVAVGVLYISVVLLSLRAENKNLPLFVAAAGSLLIILAMFPYVETGTVWNVLSNVLLALMAIWVVTLLGVRMRTLREEKKEAQLEIRLLTDLLPICTACGKIRDDDRYWHQIEAYVHGHSQMEICQGLCPDCEQKMYPEEDVENIGNSLTD